MTDVGVDVHTTDEEWENLQKMSLAEFKVKEELTDEEQALYWNQKFEDLVRILRATKLEHEGSLDYYRDKVRKLEEQNAALKKVPKPIKWWHWFKKGPSDRWYDYDDDYFL